MKVVIPVAGSGTRLRPHTYSLPKPLLHVGGRPMLAHLLDPVLQINPEEVIFVIGYRGEMIREYIESNYSFKATFIRQAKLLGLGFAINQAVQTIASGDLLVLLGDTIVECDLRKFTQAGDNVLGLHRVHDPKRFGIAVVRNGRVVELEEKPEDPKSDLAVIGLYYFRNVTGIKTALGAHVESGKMTRGEIQFTDGLEMMIRSGEVFVPYEVNEWFDCGKKETLLSTNEHIIRARNQTQPREGCVLVPPTYIHPTARVERSVLGPNVSISEGSIVTDSVLSNTVVGAHSRVERMILSDSLIGHEAEVIGVSQTLNVGDSTQINPDK